MSFMTITFGVVFQEDGLDKDGVREDLKQYCPIIDECDGKVTTVDGEEIPSWIFVMRTDNFGTYTRLKLDYNAYDDHFMLFPRAPGDFGKPVKELERVLI